MTRNEKLEQEVHEIILCLYRHQFINRLEVLSGEGEQGEPNEYVLKLYLYTQFYAVFCIQKNLFKKIGTNLALFFHTLPEKYYFYIIND